MAVIDTKNVTIKIKDAGSNNMEVKLGEGNLTYDEKRNVEYRLDRGSLDTVRLGDEVPMDVKLDSTWEFLRASGGSAVPTIEDAMKKRGVASGWASTSADICEPYAVDIEVFYDPPCGVNSATETILLPDFRWESISHDLSGGTLAFTGKCNAKEATVTRGGVSS